MKKRPIRLLGRSFHPVGCSADRILIRALLEESACFIEFHGAGCGDEGAHCRADKKRADEALP
jgi:hypothetical protein